MRRGAAATALCLAVPVLGALLAVPGGVAVAAPTPSGTRLERQLADVTGGAARLARPRGTAPSHLLGTTPARPVPRPHELAAGASPEAVARAHLRTYGSLLGVA